LLVVFIFIVRFFIIRLLRFFFVVAAIGLFFVLVFSRRRGRRRQEERTPHFLVAIGADCSFLIVASLLKLTVFLVIALTLPGLHMLIVPLFPFLLQPLGNGDVFRLLPQEGGNEGGLIPRSSAERIQKSR